MTSQQKETQVRELPSREQIVEWMDTLSNEGRWGPDDVLGTLNFITDETRLRAAQSVHTGDSVSLGWNIDPARPELQSYAARFMHGTTDASFPTAPRATHASETLLIQPHGTHITHLDGLAHVAWDGRLYNGRSTDSITPSRGAIELGLESIADGIVTRGVLLDVAAVRGVPMLELGDGVFPEDLEAAEARQGVRVEPGDAVALSTGFSRYRRLHPGWSLDEGAPGYHAACLPWLHERQVSVITSDGPNEVYPSGYPLLRNPIHLVGIPAMGLWLLHSCNLERLTELCAARRRSTFLFTIAPPRFVGATGSPVNPTALL